MLTRSGSNFLGILLQDDVYPTRATTDQFPTKFLPFFGPAFHCLSLPVHTNDLLLANIADFQSILKCTQISHHLSQLWGDFFFYDFGSQIAAVEFGLYYAYTAQKVTVLWLILRLI